MMNFKIVSLIASLITFKNKKNLIFIFNNLHFQAFILIIKKGHEVFIIIIITKCYEITNVEMNQIQNFFFKTNVSFIRCLINFFDNV